MFHKGLFLSFLVTAVLLINAVGLADGYIPPKVGETLEYKVYIKGIHSANQTVRVVEATTYRDRPVFKVHYSMDSIGLAKTITKYKETEELFLDAEGLYPWVIRKETINKDDHEVEEVTFDYANKLGVCVSSENDGPEERVKFEVPGYAQDVLSLQFYLRKYASLGNNQIYFYSSGKIKFFSYQESEIDKPLNLDCGQFPKQRQILNPEEEISILLALTPERCPLVIRKTAKFGKVEAKLVGIK